ncbi:MAG TPA: YfiR family protein [Alphaproteobacteria bacterium]|nr:YfiR family protein [Alphaproteobacteria bacterium]
MASKPLLRVSALVLLALSTAIDASRADGPGALALAVKATYLYKFQPFITWPGNAPASPGDPFRLCIVGTDPFGETIDRAVAGQHAGAQAIVVVRLTAVSPADHCQVRYLGTGDAATARRWETAIAGQPELTVTDGIAEDSAKGVINFVVSGNRVRFEIDEAAASRAGLVISSKLLSLAVSVRPNQ